MTSDRSEELCVGGGAFERVLRPMAAGDAVVAFGNLTVNDIPQAHCRQYVCSDLQTSSSWPRGLDFGPVEEWCVVVFAGFQGIAAAREVRAIVQPLPAQTVVILVLACGAQADGWDAMVARRDRLEPLAGFRVVGPGLPAFFRPELESADDSLPNQRLSRLAGIVGPNALRRLTRLRVGQAGAGGNGSEIAARLGPLVDSFRFIDPDRLAIENLDRTIGMSLSDVGRLKVDVLADRLQALRGDSLRVTPVPRSVTDPSVIDILRDVDVMITATDSDVSRAAVALYASRFQKLHLDVGTSITGDGDELRFAGDVRFFYPGQGCVFCCGGLQDEGEALYELFAPDGALPRRPPRAWHEERRGSSSALNAIVCGIAIQTLIDAVTGHQRSSTWHRVSWVRGKGLETASGPVDAGADCRLCSRRD